MSPGPSLAGWFPLLPMAVASLTRPRRAPTILRGGTPVFGGTAGQRQGGFSVVSPPARVPVTAACPARLRTLLAGVTPGVLWATGGQTTSRLVGGGAGVNGGSARPDSQHAGEGAWCKEKLEMQAKHDRVRKKNNRDIMLAGYNGGDRVKGQPG